MDAVPDYHQHKCAVWAKEGEGEESDEGERGEDDAAGPQMKRKERFVMTMPEKSGRGDAGRDAEGERERDANGARTSERGRVSLRADMRYGAYTARTSAS